MTEVKATPETVINAPRRRFVLGLKLEADSRDDLVAELMNIANHIFMGKLPTRVSGDVHSGYVYSLDEDESITHESYVEALHRYLVEERNSL